MEKSPHKDIRAMAALRLAQFLNGRSYRLDLLKERPEMVERYEGLFGKDYLQTLLRRDRADVIKEVETAFETALEKYGDAKHPWGGTVGERAKVGVARDPPPVSRQDGAGHRGRGPGRQEVQAQRLSRQGGAARLLVGVLTGLTGQWPHERSLVTETGRQALRPHRRQRQRTRPEETQGGDGAAEAQLALVRRTRSLSPPSGTSPARRRTTSSITRA